MSSGTKRENDNVRDMKTCTACLRANGVPCSPCSAFIDLETKIAQSEILLKSLIAQQNELRTKINSSHEPMIHRLPLELSTHIFELSLPPCWSTSKENEPSKAELYTVLYISAVCRTWRQIAMGIPRLWKIIPIFISDEYERHGTTLKYVEEWLQRAGDYPLSLHVHVHWGLDYTPRSKSEEGWHWYWSGELDSALLSLVALINGQSYRWQNLELVLPTKLVRIFDGDLNGAPILEKLRISPLYVEGYTDCPHGTFSLMSSIKPAPSVVDISRLARVDIRWHNVTTIEWIDFSWNECLAMLRQATRLVRCTLGYPIYILGESNLDEERTAVCPSLQFIRIGGTDRQMMAKFWNLLTLPQLRTLETTSKWSNLPYQQIMDMLDRSSCLLTSLLLEYPYCEPGDAERLFELLRHTTHLNELYLMMSNRVPWGTNLPHGVNTFCQFLNGGASPITPGNTSSEALQDGVKQLVLPNLTFLAMINVPMEDGPEIQWSGVADLFNNLASHNSLAVSHHRRPLTTLVIFFSSGHPQHETGLVDPPPPPFYIDSESVRRFSDIIQSGEITLEFLVPDPICPDGDVDLIASSIQHSGISPHERVVPDEHNAGDLDEGSAS